ncbi:MAG: type II secretion system protein GspG [Pirellulaceae bacterium]|nr:type II secretion system protein GspG [Pirellulaceae bacterium]
MNKPDSASNVATYVLLALAGLAVLALVGFLVCGVGGFFFAFTRVQSQVPVPPPVAVSSDMAMPEQSIMEAEPDVDGDARSADQAPEDRVQRAEEAELLLRKQLDLYRLDVGSYPETTAGLDALREKPEALTNPDAWRGPYADQIPLDPWGHPYRYERPQEDTFRLWSMGPDGVDGSVDDVEARVDLNP